MYSFELTDRGKITVAVLIVIPILILSIVLAIFAFAADAPDEPPGEPSANEPHETITQPGLTETQEPPDSGGFPPPPDNNDTDIPPTGDVSLGDASPYDYLDEYPYINNDDDLQDPLETPPSPPISDPSLNLSTGQFTFYFYPHFHTTLDRETQTLLNTFLNLPSNTSNSVIAIETPPLSSDDSDLFMSIMTSALGERNIDSNQITHIVNPEMPQEERFEVVMYFIREETK